MLSLPLWQLPHVGSDCWCDCCCASYAPVKLAVSGCAFTKLRSPPVDMPAQLSDAAALCGQGQGTESSCRLPAAPCFQHSSSCSSTAALMQASGAAAGAQWYNVNCAQ
jgi:hypothetical protein